jgi:hypothetical protein
MDLEHIHPSMMILLKLCAVLLEENRSQDKQEASNFWPRRLNDPRVCQNGWLNDGCHIPLAPGRFLV